MPYTVRWKRLGGSETATSPRFDDVRDAMEFACGLLRSHPMETWVENEFGDAIADDRVIARRRKNHTASPRH